MALFNMDNLQIVLYDSERDSAEVSKQLLHQAEVRNMRHIREIEEAVDVCFRMTVDILLVDMDNKNGYGKRLIRRLRKLAAERPFETRILALIGTNEQEAVLSAASCGVDSIIIKPVSAIDVKKRIISLHEKEVSYLRFDKYFGPDRRLVPDRLPDGEVDKREGLDQHSI